MYYIPSGMSLSYNRPISWGCRIRWLHLCRRVRPLLNEATCLPWLATRKALGRIPGGWAVIDPATEWSMACNTPLWPLLGLTGGRMGPIRSIGWSCQALAPIYIIPTVLLNLHLQQVPNLYLIIARGRWLRVNCVENWNLTSAENLKLATARKPILKSSIPHLNQGEWVTPLVNSQLKLDSVVDGGRRASEIYIQHMWRLQTKNLNETSQNQTWWTRQQTSPDSLLLNHWRKSA